MAQLKEKSLRSEEVFLGKFLRILRDRVLCPDGKERDREYVKHPGAAVIVAVTDEGKLVMLRQYRHALREVFIEFPAGKRDEGEDSAVTARRELKEETGYEAKHWKLLGRIHPCIGYSDEFIDVHYARGLTQTGARPDPGEELESFLIGIDDFKSMIRRGEVTDAKSLSAFFFFEKMLREDW